MSEKWKWIVGWIAGFGEVAVQVIKAELEGKEPVLRARRLTISQLRPAAKGATPVWAKWYPTHFGFLAEVLEIRRESLAIWADASKPTEELLVSIWTDIVTATEAPPNGPMRRLP